MTRSLEKTPVVRTSAIAGTEGPDPDGPLVTRFRSGDAKAFDEIVLRHQRMVYGLLRILLGRHEDADDLAQEVFLRAYRHLGGFEGRASLKTWLTRITIHMAINHRKSWWVRRRGEGEMEDIPEAGRDQIPSPLRAVLLEEERAALATAIADLPDRQRETLRLVVSGTMRYAEIARSMGCTEGTVKANFFHAVRKLRRALNPEPAAGESPQGGEIP